MNIDVTRSLHLSTGLSPIFNFNIEDEEQRHLCYQILAIKILIFTYMSETKFAESATCYMNFLCIPHHLPGSEHFAIRILARLYNTILVTSANVAPMQLFYVMVLFRTIFIPGLEILMDIYLLWSVISFVCHNYLNLVLFHNVPLWDLRLLAIRLTVEVYKSVKKIRPLSWIHIPCSIIIWIACTYGKMSHELDQEMICRKLVCLTLTTHLYDNNSLMQIEIQTRYEL